MSDNCENRRTAEIPGMVNDLLHAMEVCHGQLDILTERLSSITTPSDPKQTAPMPPEAPGRMVNTALGADLSRIFSCLLALNSKIECLISRVEL